MTVAHLSSPSLLEQLEEALVIMAEVVGFDPRALVIFERIDREHAAIQTTVSLRAEDDPVAKARALVRLRKEASQ